MDNLSSRMFCLGTYNSIDIEQNQASGNYSFILSFILKSSQEGAEQYPRVGPETPGNMLSVPASLVFTVGAEGDLHVKFFETVFSQ